MTDQPTQDAIVTQRDRDAEEVAWKNYYRQGEPNGFYITTSATTDAERIFRAGYRAALKAKVLP